MQSQAKEEMMPGYRHPDRFCIIPVDKTLVQAHLSVADLCINPGPFRKIKNNFCTAPWNNGLRRIMRVSVYLPDSADKIFKKRILRNIEIRFHAFLLKFNL